MKWLTIVYIKHLAFRKYLKVHSKYRIDTSPAWWFVDGLSETRTVYWACAVPTCSRPCGPWSSPTACPCSTCCSPAGTERRDGPCFRRAESCRCKFFTVLSRRNTAATPWAGSSKSRPRFRRPESEFHFDISWFSQSFDDYGFDDSVNGYKTFLSYGDKPWSATRVTTFLSTVSKTNLSRRLSVTAAQAPPPIQSVPVTDSIVGNDERGRSRNW